MGRDAAFAKPPPAPDINLPGVELYRFRYVATSNLGRAAASKKPSPAPDIISVAIPGTHLRRSPPRVRPKAIARAYVLPVAQRGYAIVVRRSLHRFRGAQLCMLLEIRSSFVLFYFVFFVCFYHFCCQSLLFVRWCCTVVFCYGVLAPSRGASAAERRASVTRPGLS